MIGGELSGLIGNERDLGRTDIHHERQELVGGITLHIEFGGNHGLELVHVFLADMPLVRARMNRNSLGTKELTIDCKSLYIRHVAPARVAQRSNLIDIHTEFRHD